MNFSKVAVIYWKACCILALAINTFLAMGQTPESLAVLSLNIRYNNPEDGPDRWDLRKEELADFLRQSHALSIGL